MGHPADGAVRNATTAARALPVMAAVLLFLQGCAVSITNSGERPGVYAVQDGSDTPGWIGEPAGIPVWSPDGQELAWASEDGLKIASLAGSESRSLTNHPVVGRPAWSPEGDAIAFIDEEKASLVVAESTSGTSLLAVPIAGESAQGSPQELLTFGGPAWSPDGSQLAYVCWDGAGDELCLIGVDGTGGRKVTKLEPPAEASNAPAGSNAGPPAWSPDGSKLAVAAYPERRGAPAGVFVIDLDRGTSLRVSELLPNSEITWSPDGKSLIFSATEKGRGDVWRIEVNSSQSSRMTADLPTGGRSPALSPDGKHLAVASDGAIVVLGDANDVRRIAASGLKGMDPAWSPAGEEIAFAAAPNPIGSYD